MSQDEIKNNEDLVSEDIQQDAEELENQEELVEDEQVENEETLEEGGSYGKKSKKMEADHEDDEDEDEDDMKEGSHDDEDEEDEEPEVKEISIPKTKAATIQAAVEMLKKAKKEDAQKLYARMARVSEGEEEDSIASVDKATKATKKMAEPKAKAKVEAVDFEEDLDAIISEEATLSDGFRGKAGAIFEAVLTSKLTQEVERLESEYAQNIEEEVSDIKNELVEKVDSYLNYVVSNWMDDNEVAVTNGLRTEIAEEFMTSLQSVFKEHYIDVPEGKVDLVDELSEQVAELEETLNKTTEDNIKLHESVQTLERAEVVRESSSGLADTEAEKLSSLVEDIEFDNKENFKMKVDVVKESYFKKEINETADEVSEVVGNDEAPADIGHAMSQYTQAISKFNK